MITPTIYTERLVMKPFGTELAEEIYSGWASDPRVTEYMPYNTHTDSDVTREWLRTVEAGVNSDNSYDWAIYIKETGELIGSCGIYYNKAVSLFEPGYNLKYTAWRQGYGTETMARIVKFALEDLKQTCLRALCDKENAVSRHILEKCGFVYDHDGCELGYDGITKREMNYLYLRIPGVNSDFVLTNGIKIPAVGFGSYKSTDGIDSNSKSPIQEALDAGYRYIDTASFYHNEEAIGETLSKCGIPREELFIASKLWPSEMGYEEALEAFERSLSKLRTDYLDLYLVHWPRRNSEDSNWKQTLRETWRALEKLYAEGRVRAIGVSNFAPHHLKVITENCQVIPMINQLELHVGYMQDYTLKYCFEHNILTQAWSPLGRTRVLGETHIMKLAAKYNVTEAQLLLRFLNQRGIPVIPKSTKRERLLENLDLFRFTIDDFDMSYLSTMPEVGWSGEHPDWENKV